MLGRVHLIREASFHWLHCDKLGKETRNQGEEDKVGVVQMRWINVENIKREVW